MDDHRERSEREARRLIDECLADNEQRDSLQKIVNHSGAEVRRSFDIFLATAILYAIGDVKAPGVLQAAQALSEALDGLRQRGPGPSSAAEDSSQALEDAAKRFRPRSDHLYSKEALRQFTAKFCAERGDLIETSFNH